ncbi:hypothetical protein F0562_018279 [Nyssa sinensis]|uniref:alpha-1,2-Mannosidase n=1 Tax=Nyssa sinensis TaxID=561372 RepID=A0A5J4Z8C4_9ASTE|nr:hypothetical protein F0562_018279 [Nyssa sinensis]
MKGVRHLVRKSIPNELVFVGESPYGPNGAFSPKMDHLACFLSGTLALGATKGITKEKTMKDNFLPIDDEHSEGGLDGGNKSSKYVNDIIIKHADSDNLLRPETVESLFILYCITEDPKYREWGWEFLQAFEKYTKKLIVFLLKALLEDPKYREWGWEIFQAFEKYTKVNSGGYSSLDDVTMLSPQRRDKMDTFFLGETLKHY